MEILGVLVGLLTLMAIKFMSDREEVLSIVFVLLGLAGVFTGFCMWPYSHRFFNILAAVWCADILLFSGYRVRHQLLSGVQTIFVKSRNAQYIGEITYRSFVQGFGAGLGFGLVWLLTR